MAGPDVLICDECIDLCAHIIIEADPQKDFPDRLPRLFGILEKQNAYGTTLSALDGQPLYSIEGLSVRPKTCFYLGPLTEPFNTIYSDHVKTTVERSGFSITRADEIFGSRAIMQDIWESLFCSEFIIADVTGKNPNVMYEIGLAHTMGKPVVMMTPSIEDVPFDLRHFRCVLYTFTPRGCEDLVARLKGTVSALENVAYNLSFRR